MNIEYNKTREPKSHNNRNEDDDIRVRLQDMDKVTTRTDRME